MPQYAAVHKCLQALRKPTTSHFLCLRAVVCQRVLAPAIGLLLFVCFQPEGMAVLGVCSNISSASMSLSRTSSLYVL